MEYAQIIAAAASIIGSLIGAGEDAKAQAIRQQMADEYGADILPGLDEMVAEQAGFSALGAEDTDARNIQMDVDSQLRDAYERAGQTPEDVAAYDVARRGVSSRAAQQSQNVAQESARRGQIGGPLAAVLAEQSGQSELDALAGMNAQIASDARGRGLQALGMRAQNASGVRSQDWRAKSDRATAADLMSRFNASQRQVAAQYNAQLPQTQYTNNLARLAGRNNALAGVASGHETAGAAARQTGAGLGNAALSYGSAWDDEDDK